MPRAEVIDWVANTISIHLMVRKTKIKTEDLVSFKDSFLSSQIAVLFYNPMIKKRIKEFFELSSIKKFHINDSIKSEDHTSFIGNLILLIFQWFIILNNYWNITLHLDIYICFTHLPLKLKFY